jgi:hypothetical protein
MNQLPMKSQETSEIEMRSVYSGRPKNAGEESNWKKFLSWLVPWLNQKRLLGEAYLEAEVQKEQAQARDLEASAKLKHAQAEKEHAEAILSLSKAQEVAAETALKYHQLENQKLKAYSPPGTDVERTAQWKQRLDILEDKIAKLKIEYGGDIKVFPPKAAQKHQDITDIPSSPDC